MEVLSFFENLKNSDWNVDITNKRKVKDVLSHLIGWERECAKELVKVFKTKKELWFILTESYDKFNEKIYQEFKNYSPSALISELEKWQQVL